jgi:hypothetical protein
MERTEGPRGRLSLMDTFMIQKTRAYKRQGPIGPIRSHNAKESLAAAPWGFQLRNSGPPSIV